MLSNPNSACGDWSPPLQLYFPDNTRVNRYFNWNLGSLSRCCWEECSWSLMKKASVVHVDEDCPIRMPEGHWDIIPIPNFWCKQTEYCVLQIHWIFFPSFSCFQLGVLYRKLHGQIKSLLQSLKTSTMLFFKAPWGIMYELYVSVPWFYHLKL